MRRYLVVANQTLLGDHLVAKIRECLLAGPCQFYVVVPAAHTKDHLLWTEGHDRAVARLRLDEALERFRSLGADVDGEIGDPRPVDAIGDACRHAAPFDEIILSTLPAGMSRWLRQDLPHRVERAFGLPTSVLTAARAVAA
jgi:hypothetical protein